MQTLTENATSLALALSVKYIDSTPILADAHALLVGRPHLWRGWETAPPIARSHVAQLIKYRPPDLNHAGRFIENAQKLFESNATPFRLVDAQVGLGHTHQATELDPFALKAGFDIDGLIDEMLVALAHGNAESVAHELPHEGPIILKEPLDAGYRTFEISKERRKRIIASDARLPIRETPFRESFSWGREQLTELAQQLDDAGKDPANRLHCSHRSSLDAIFNKRLVVEALAGIFYRVNAPTGTGKSVVMELMALLIAMGGDRVVITVPNLTDVKNAVESLKSAARVVAPHLKITPLHSQRKIAKAAHPYLLEGRDDHPYDYRCILDSCASDDSVSVRDLEPCFNLLLVGSNNGKETFKRIRNCPFLNQCGKQTMLEEALSADIVVVNHHALISSTTRIPVDGQLSTRSILDLLLRSCALFLIDEIDGLLQSAIDTSVFSLALSNHREHSSLAQLNLEIFDRDFIPGVDARTLYRAQRACTATILHSTRLLNLAENHIVWPERETVWERAEDNYLSEFLGVDTSLLDSICGYSEDEIPPHLTEIRDLLRSFSRNNPVPHPQEVANEMGGVLWHIASLKKLHKRATDDTIDRLKSALIIRTSLHYIEESLRTLYADVPTLVRAKVPAALKVQQDLSGSRPFSPTPLGPLQRIVYGFKRKKADWNAWSLEVVALCGDPHRTLQYLPNLTSLIFANAERTFIGFSATAFFPGASCFDLQAKTLIDVPDTSGNIRFVNIPVTERISGSGLDYRLTNVRKLAAELWPWLDARLAALAADDLTRDRTRLLLVTGSHAEAEELASTLYELAQGERRVAWVRGGNKDDQQIRLPIANKLVYDDLANYASGPHTTVELLVSSIYPIARGHNIVTPSGKSALGGVVVCVRPMPSSDQADKNLGHVCYTAGRDVLPNDHPGLALIEERILSNRTLNGIRVAPPYFSRQPPEVRFFTLMNILVVLTQLVGRARRGGTPVTCYLADAAFVDNAHSWADLLKATVRKLL
ncbi:hypothetical protein, partial [Pseudomonas sp. CJQ_13]|uniref:hypothetical protein n=1 Tax=Pseudomonas sp. CJQ_13 TaxID=3367170 RepID=UPI00370C8C04